MQRLIFYSILLGILISGLSFYRYNSFEQGYEQADTPPSMPITEQEENQGFKYAQNVGRSDFPQENNFEYGWPLKFITENYKDPIPGQAPSIYLKYAPSKNPLEAVLYEKSEVNIVYFILNSLIYTVIFFLTGFFVKKSKQMKATQTQQTPPTQ